MVRSIRARRYFSASTCCVGGQCAGYLLRTDTGAMRTAVKIRRADGYLTNSSKSQSQKNSLFRQLSNVQKFHICGFFSKNRKKTLIFDEFCVNMISAMGMAQAMTCTRSPSRPGVTSGYTAVQASRDKETRRRFLFLLPCSS